MKNHCFTHYFQVPKKQKITILLFLCQVYKERTVKIKTNTPNQKQSFKPKKRKMQRLLSLKRASSNLPKKLSNTSTSSSLLHSHHSYDSKPFSSLTKPQNQSLSSFLSHPLHHQVHSHSSWHSFSGKTIHGFFSNPVIAKQFLLNSPNTLLKVSTSKSLVDCRVSFQRQSFRFNPSFDSHRRGW